jgi:regulatory protein
MQIKTEGQVRDYLKRKEYKEDEISAAIDFLKDYDYINDIRYCQSYYKQACRKGRGRKRIEQELQNKKISKGVIKDALDEMLSDENPDYDDIMEELLTERERALKVGQKMLVNQLGEGKPIDKNFMAKVGRRLMSLGYGGDVVYSVIGELIKEDGEEY